VFRVIGNPLGILAVLSLRLTSKRVGVALMYHSVEHRSGDPARELVPPHHAEAFTRQVEHVARHYRVVPALRLQAEAAQRRRGQRFPVAITFDDDLACHATVSMPILRKRGLTATYFVSGASLDRPFAFWYERLQRAYDLGLRDLTRLVLGDGDAGDLGLHEIGLRVEHMSPEERDGVGERLASALGPDPLDAGLRADQVRALVEGGMTIGFHTRRHDSLSFLDDTQLERALRDGRDELEQLAGAPLDVIGYPHGRADARVAEAARAAGFRAGFTTRPVAVTEASDALLLGRIGPLRSARGFALQLALTLLRTENDRSTAAPARRAS
jgi:peptidoglycan/xylan/chitin deacetylase (PgdA/CDA1 family)